ncbi:MAG: ABC transporter permease [Lachnospiraceae bacterium]|nr:ABC transporter permease [Lachnospiraceae bacterium]
MRKYTKLWSVYASSKKIIVLLIVVGVFLGLIPNFAQLSFTSSENEVVRSAQQAFGTYAVRIGDVVKGDEVALKKYKNVKKVVAAECYTESFDEKVYYFNYGTGADIEMLGMFLEKGALPKAENEILIDKNYMALKEYNYNVIGKEIKVEVSEGKFGKFIVSGVVRTQSAFEEYEAYEFNFYVYKEKFKKNTLYASFYDYSKLNSDYRKLEKCVKGKVYPNLGMYLFLGYGSDSFNLFEQYDLLYACIYAFILLSMCFIIYNVAKMCIYDSYESIGVLNMLGIHKQALIISFLSFVLILSGIGIVLGVIISAAIVCIIHLTLYHTLINYIVLFQNYPYQVTVLSIILCLTVTALVLMPLLIRIKRMSPNEVMRQEIIFDKLKQQQEKILFPKDTKHICIKLAANNLSREKVMNVISVLGIAIGTVMITIGIFYLKTNYSKMPGNDNYDYKIQMYDSVLSDKNHKLRDKFNSNMGFSNEVEVHALFECVKKLIVPPQKLSGKYREFLSQDVEIARLLAKGKDIELYVKILGYDEKELENLYKKNSMKAPCIAGTEAIVLNDIYSLYGNGVTIENPFKAGDKVDLVLDDIVSLKVKAGINRLTIYPTSFDFAPVLIITKEKFVELFGQDVPEYVYIDKPKSEKDQENLEMVLADRQHYVTYPKQEKEELERLNRILRVFVYILFCICILVSAGLLFSSYYLKVYIHKKEYAMLYTIGFDNWKIKSVVLLEVFFSFMVSIFFSIFVSYLATKQIYLIKYPSVGTYLYNFPVKTFAISCGIALLFSLFVWKLILNKLERALNVEVLRSL